MSGFWRPAHCFFIVGTSQNACQLCLHKYENIHRSHFLGYHFQDIPNAFYRDPQSFHNVLRKFTINGRSPLVFIISDTYGGESSAYKLFPKDVQGSLGVENVRWGQQTHLLLFVQLSLFISFAESRVVAKSFRVKSSYIFCISFLSSQVTLNKQLNCVTFYCCSASVLIR